MISRNHFYQKLLRPVWIVPIALTILVVISNARDLTFTAILVSGIIAGLVTEKALSRNALRKSKHAVEIERENFRNLFRQTPEMVCILSGPNHVFEFVNEAHVKALGFDATGMAVREAQPESVEVHGILDDVYRTGITAELYEIPITVTDRLRYFNLTYSARRDQTGATNGIMVLGREVTEEVQNRNVAREAQARLELALESGNMGTWQIDLSSRKPTFSKETQTIFGYEEKSLVHTFKDILHPEDRVRVAEAFEDSIKSGKPYSAEFRIIRPDGRNRWILARGNTSYSPDGTPLLTAGIAMDVTERKMAADELAESRERYKVLFDHSPLPKMIFDLETFKILEVNETAIQHYGYSREEFLAMTALDLRPKEDVEFFKKSVEQRHLNRDNTAPVRYRHLKKDGTIITVEVSALDIVIRGRLARLCAIVDVTDKTIAEAEQRSLVARLQQAKQEAERANELKSAFLANMSHEIRTPLGAMIGFADLLRDPGLTESERINYINTVIRNGEQLSEIINDILDLSKVEAGHLTLEYAETSPEEIAHDVISLLSVKANEEGLKLEFRAEPLTPRKVVTDPLRLRQILMNVVGNAVKFTQSGSVKIRSFGTRDETGRISLYYEVTDTGIGIPETERERIFKAFVQADGTLSRKFGGTGLGLALSRQLARNLGGELSITDSVVGRGSTFLIEIQDKPEKKSEPSSNQTSEIRSSEISGNALSGIRVLVVDDSADNRQLIRHLLSKFGADVDFAENGSSGYRKALLEDFDVVLMDIQMPEMDGYTATQRLREAGYRKPIVALTAHAMNETRVKCLNVGCTDHLAKPIKPQDLIGTVAKYAEH